MFLKNKSARETFHHIHNQHIVLQQKGKNVVIVEPGDVKKIKL